MWTCRKSSSWTCLNQVLDILKAGKNNYIKPKLPSHGSDITRYQIAGVVIYTEMYE